MFEWTDFVDIMNYLKGDSVVSLDQNLKIRASAEVTKATTLFENTIDQICFASDDYKRLKSFLINWYATHRTISSTQEDISNIFSVPSDHLDELFRSFGFNYSSDLDSFISKANFFLDLVNLYKIKGAPQSIIQTLNYYGVVDLEILEYWVEKDEDENVVFRPEKVDPYIPGEKILPLTNIGYSTMTRDDPHWMIDENDLLQQVSEYKIALPSKSPYFAIRPKYGVEDIYLPLLIIQRYIQDQYSNWQSTGVKPTKSLVISKIRFDASVLELYLATVHTFNTTYSRTTGSSDLNFFCYDGTNVIHSQIVDEYEYITQPPGSRFERDNKIQEFMDKFTRPMTSNFLQTYTTAGDTLEILDSDIKTAIDNLVDAGKGEDTVKYLIRDLAGWIKTYVGPDYPDLAAFMFGLEALPFVSDIVNFFKPYHARLKVIDTLLIIDSPLLDSVKLADIPINNVVQEIVDFSTCGGVPCCDGTTCTYYQRDTYDCGSFYDKGAACDNKFEMVIYQNIDEKVNFTPGMVDGTDVSFVQTGDLPLDYHDATTVVSAYRQCGQWTDFDSGGYFDAPHGNDICEIFVVEP